MNFVFCLIISNLHQELVDDIFMVFGFDGRIYATLVDQENVSDEQTRNVDAEADQANATHYGV
jgi:hypothetical protein